MAMQTLFMDGFDHYTDLLQKWDASSSATYNTITSAISRNGGQSLRIGSIYFIKRALGIDARTVVVGCAVYQDGIQTQTSSRAIINLACEGGIQLAVCWNPSSRLEVRMYNANGTLLATSANSFAQGQWHYVELRAYIDNTAGEIELRVNGITEATFTGDTQYLTGYNYVNRLELSGDNSAIYYFDDLYVRGDTVNTAGGFFGDCKVVTRYPQADGAYAQMTPLTGPGHYTEVDEALGDADTSYVSSATSGHRESYDMQAVGEAGEVRAVQAVAMLRKADAGYRVARNLVKSGATVAVSGDKGLGTDYRAVPQVYDTDPNTGLAWTVAGLDAAEFGVEIG